MNRYENNFRPDFSAEPENLRSGREMYRQSPHSWNGQNNPNAGLEHRHQAHPNFRPDQSAYNNAGPDYNNYSETHRQNYLDNRQNPYYPEDYGQRHHDDTFWAERNDYKDDDYRYRSGHRDYWHKDLDQEYNNNQNYRENMNRNNSDFSNYGNNRENTGNYMTNANQHSDGLFNGTHPYNHHHFDTRPYNYRHYENLDW